MFAKKLKSYAQHIVREDRYLNAQSLCKLEILNRLYEVVNYSAFGVAVKVPPGFAFDEDISATFFVNSSPIKALTLKKLRSEALHEGSVEKVAFEIVDDYLPCERIDAAVQLENIFAEHAEYQEKEKKLSLNFKSAVFTIKNQLENLEIKINEIRPLINLYETSEVESFESYISERTSSVIKTFFSEFYQQITKDLTSIDNQERELFIEYFRHTLNYYFKQSPYAEMALSGENKNDLDYLTLEQIYHFRPMGQSLFAKCLHHYYLHEAHNQNIKGMSLLLSKKISSFLLQRNIQYPINILSFMSHHTYEIENLMATWTPDEKDCEINFTFVDAGIKNLKMSKDRLRKLSRQSNINFHFSFEHVNLQDYLAEPDKKTYDLIYAPFIFNYFSNSVAKIIADVLWKQIKNNGKLLIANLNGTGPADSLVQYALNWHLVYRKKSDLNALFSDLSKNYSVTSSNEVGSWLVEMSK